MPSLSLTLTACPVLVEDDARLAELVTEYLSGYEFSVDLVTRGDAALDRFKELSPDVVVLDLMLPGLDGMVVCRQLRELSDVPILILTAREDSYDEVSGLEQGADDFVNKPVQPRVLLARLRALMRRTQAKSGGDARVLQFGALRIATSDRSVVWRGQPCVLSNTEYKLLLVLVTSKEVRGIRSARDLGRSTMIAFAHGCSYRKRLEDWLGSDNVMPEHALEFGSYQGMIACVAAGTGFAIMPRSVLAALHASDKVNQHPLPERFSANRTHLVWRGERSLALDRLVAVLQELEAPGVDAGALIAA